MMVKQNSILTMVVENDALILDRGFRDVVDLIENKNIKVFMPKLLYKSQKFDARDANLSRVGSHS